MGAARKVQDWTAILVDEDLGTILRVKDALQRHDCVVAVASADTVVAVAEAHKNALVFLAPTSADLDARVRLGKRVLVLEDTCNTLEGEGGLLAEISTRASFHSRRYLQSE